NDGQASGDWAVDVIALPPASGKMGMRYVLSLGGSPPGLAQVDFDEHGSITNQIGSNFAGGGGGVAGPLDDKASVDALAPYGANQFIAGAGGSGTQGQPLVVRLDAGFANGAPLIGRTSALSYAGRAVVTGNLFSPASANPDVVVMGQLSMSVIQGGDP